MSDNRIAITGKAKENIEKLVLQANQIGMAINNYVQGIIDAKELDGIYQLDVKTMELVKQEDKPKTE